MKKGKAIPILQIVKADNTVTSLNTLTDDITVLSNDNANIQVTTEGQAIKIDSSQVSANKADIATNKTAIAKNLSKHGIPSGGKTNQILTKTSNTNYDVTWKDNSSNFVSCNEIIINNGTMNDTYEVVDCSAVIGKREALLFMKFIGHSKGGKVWGKMTEDDDTGFGGNNDCGWGAGSGLATANRVTYIVLRSDKNGCVSMKSYKGITCSVILSAYQVGESTTESVPDHKIYCYDANLNNISTDISNLSSNINITGWGSLIPCLEKKEGCCQQLQNIGKKDELWQYRADPYPEHRDYCKWVEATGYELDNSKKDELIEVLWTSLSEKRDYITDKLFEYKGYNININKDSKDDLHDLYLDASDAKMELTLLSQISNRTPEQEAEYQNLLKWEVVWICNKIELTGDVKVDTELKLTLNDAIALDQLRRQYRSNEVFDIHNIQITLKNKTMEELIDLLNTKEIVI